MMLVIRVNNHGNDIDDEGNWANNHGDDNDDVISHAIRFSSPASNERDARCSHLSEPAATSLTPLHGGPKDRTLPNLALSLGQGTLSPNAAPSCLDYLNRTILW
eukprot:jgi/Botrbrau1/2569/Bobra.0079s0053.1